MCKDMLRQVEFGGHEERGPKNRVKTGNLLADQVQVRRPEVFFLDRAHIGDQRIEPDIENVMAFDGGGNTPLDRRAGDGKIYQPLFDERDDFVAFRLRKDEVRLLLVEFQKLALKRGKFEEV